MAAKHFVTMEIFSIQKFVMWKFFFSIILYHENFMTAVHIVVYRKYSGIPPSLYNEIIEYPGIEICIKLFHSNLDTSCTCEYTFFVCIFRWPRSLVVIVLGRRKSRSWPWGWSNNTIHTSEWTTASWRENTREMVKWTEPWIDCFFSRVRMRVPLLAP